MNRKLVSIAAAALLAVLLLGGSGYLLLARVHAAEAATAPADHALGSPGAPVTVIEYGAPSCPVCARFAAQVMPLLKKNYIDTGKVFFIFRVYPLRAADGAAEKMARCLPPAKYFSFLGLLFRDQRLWDEEFGADPHKGLLRMGHLVGLSQARIDQCIGDTAQDADINRIAAEGDAKYNITGTPTFVVGGVGQPSGSLEWDEMKALIDKALVRK